MSALQEAIGALRAALPPASAPAYWKALADFVRFEISKPSFDRAALAALGPHTALHNAFIMALLRDAMIPAPHAKSEAGEPSASTTLLERIPELAHGGPAAGEKRQRPDDDVSSSSASAAPAPPTAPSGPTLVLKIRSDGGGGLAASTERPELRVDPREEEQLNSLYDRLIDLARQNGVHSVQPEAAAIVARAVRAQTHRLLAAAVTEAASRPVQPGSGGGGGGGGGGRPSRRLSGADISQAIRKPAAAGWMLPPNQQAGTTLGSWKKFVS